MMLNVLQRFAALTALLSLSAAAHAATVYDLTGPSPFGFANQNPAAAGWSQTVTYTDVTISAPLADLSSGGPIAGVQGTVYLMNQVGLGTTSANNVAPPVAISGLTATFTPRVLFSGLTLGPGNYYLVWVSTSTESLSMSMQGSGGPLNLTLGTGVADLGNSSGLVPAPFPPATGALSPTEPANNYFFTVTGTLASPPPAGVPALGPGSMIVLASLLALLALVVLRRRH